MISLVRKMLRDPGGAGAAEFALTVPLLLVLLFGVIDGGRYMWTVNRAEKATQIGVRYAAATDLVAPEIGATNYVGVSVTTGSGTVTLKQGDVIPAEAFGVLTCQRTACSCTTAPCPTISTVDSTAFDRIVTRMANIYPEITASNVRVEYRASGLGFAGDPNGPDIAPIVTIRLVNMQFEPATFVIFGGAINLPDFRAALTLEDGSGAMSN